MASDIVRPLLDRSCDKAAFCSDAVNYSDLILSCNVMTRPIAIGRVITLQLSTA